MPPISRLSPLDRFTQVLKRTTPKLPGEIREEFAAMITPTTLAVMAGTLAAWGASHYFGIGFVFDILLLVGGVILLGVQVWAAANDFVSAIQITMSAKTEADLDQAADHMANFIAVVGVATFMAVVGKGARAAVPRVSTRIAIASGRMAGMLPAHFAAVQRLAQQTKMIIAFRNTNPLAAKWIAKGFPGKPLSVKIKSSPRTGIVTAAPKEIAAARSAGFAVVDADGVARAADGKVLRLDAPDWPVEPGQVIHPTQRKPLVGDYDLLGVIDPDAPGRNIVLATRNEGEEVANRTNPLVQKVINAINSQLDQPRVLHGAWDGFDDAGKAGGATVFFPDGTVLELNRSEFVAAWYKWMGRRSVIKNAPGPKHTGPYPPLRVVPPR